MANIASMIGLSAALPFWSMPGTHRAPVNQQVREWLSHVEDPVESPASPSPEEQEVSEHVNTTTPPNNDTTPPAPLNPLLQDSLDPDSLMCRVHRYREVIKQARAVHSLASDEASPGDDTIPYEDEETLLALCDSIDLDNLDWLCHVIVKRPCPCMRCNSAARKAIELLERVVSPPRGGHETSLEDDTTPSEDDETCLLPFNTSILEVLFCNIMDSFMRRDDHFDEGSELLEYALSTDRDDASLEYDEPRIARRALDELCIDLAALEASVEDWHNYDTCMHVRRNDFTDEEIALLEFQFYVPERDASPEEDDETPTEVAQRVPKPRKRRNHPRRQKQVENHSKRNKNGRRFDGASRFRTR